MCWEQQGTDNSTECQVCKAGLQWNLACLGVALRFVSNETVRVRTECSSGRHCESKRASKCRKYVRKLLCC